MSVTPKPFNLGDKIRRSIYYGQPNIFAAEDLDRHFQAIDAFLVEMGAQVGPVSSNIQVTHDAIPTPVVSGGNITFAISNLRIQSIDGLNPMYLWADGVRFTVPSLSPYTANVQVLNDSNAGLYVYLVAELHTVTFSEDPVMSGINATGLLAPLPSSDTILYRNERLVVATSTAGVTLNSGEVIVGIIAALKKVESYTSPNLSYSWVISLVPQDIATLIDANALTPQDDSIQRKTKTNNSLLDLVLRLFDKVTSGLNQYKKYADTTFANLGNVLRLSKTLMTHRGTGSLVSDGAGTGYLLLDNTGNYYEVINDGVNPVSATSLIDEVHFTDTFTPVDGTTVRILFTVPCTLVHKGTPTSGYKLDLSLYIRDAYTSQNFPVRAGDTIDLTFSQSTINQGAGDPSRWVVSNYKTSNDYTYVNPCTPDNATMNWLPIGDFWLTAQNDVIKMLLTFVNKDGSRARVYLDLTQDTALGTLPSKVYLKLIEASGIFTGYTFFLSYNYNQTHGSQINATRVSLFMTGVTDAGGANYVTFKKDFHYGDNFVLYDNGAAMDQPTGDTVKWAGFTQYNGLSSDGYSSIDYAQIGNPGYNPSTTWDNEGNEYYVSGSTIGIRPRANFYRFTNFNTGPLVFSFIHGGNVSAGAEVEILFDSGSTAELDLSISDNVAIPAGTKWATIDLASFKPNAGNLPIKNKTSVRFRYDGSKWYVTNVSTPLPYGFKRVGTAGSYTVPTNVPAGANMLITLTGELDAVSGTSSVINVTKNGVTVHSFTPSFSGTGNNHPVVIRCTTTVSAGDVITYTSTLALTNPIITLDAY